MVSYRHIYLSVQLDAGILGCLVSCLSKMSYTEGVGLVIVALLDEVSSGLTSEVRSLFSCNDGITSQALIPVFFTVYAEATHNYTTISHHSNSVQACRFLQLNFMINTFSNFRSV